MTPEQLKASILQLAIQGKLVPQRPEDGSAEELYQQIQREKKKLVTAGKLKKEKPLPPVTEEEIPFDIPDSWKWVRLGELYNFINGDRGKNYPAKSTLHKHGIPFISAINIRNKSVSQDGLLCVSEEQFQRLRSGHLVKGDIVVCIRGSLGKFCVYPFERGAIASSLVILRHITRDYDKFLEVYLDTYYFQEKIAETQNGTAQPNLSAKDFANFILPLPPPAEQQRIVEKIEQILPLVEQYGEAYTALESLDARFPDDMRKSILQYAIQGKLVPQRPEEGTAEDLYQQIQREKKKLIAAGKLKKEKPLPPISEEEIPFDIPDTWKWCRVGDFFTNATGLAYKKDALSIKSDNMTRVLRGGNIGEGTYTFKSDDVFIDSSFVNPALYLKKGTLITPAVSSLEQIGKIALINQSYDNVVVGGFVLMLLPFLAEDILLKYLLAFFSSDHHRASCREITHKSGQAFYNLSRAKLMNLIVPLPPRAEQKRIVEKIEKMLA